MPASLRPLDVENVDRSADLLMRVCLRATRNDQQREQKTGSPSAKVSRTQLQVQGTPFSSRPVHEMHAAQANGSGPNIPSVTGGWEDEEEDDEEDDEEEEGDGEEGDGEEGEEDEGGDEGTVSGGAGAGAGGGKWKETAIPPHAKKRLRQVTKRVFRWRVQGGVIICIRRTCPCDAMIRRLAALPLAPLRNRWSSVFWPLRAWHISPVFPCDSARCAPPARPDRCAKSS